MPTLILSVDERGIKAPLVAEKCSPRVPGHHLPLVFRQRPGILNVQQHAPIAITFTPADRAANIAAQDRMVKLAGSAEQVVPGHDPEQFLRLPVEGRVARIR